MARRSHDESVDRLYQLPPAEFTRERNALAKEAGGEEGERIRTLPKPSAPAWAVNQLFWHDRGTYEALVKASEQLRAAHRAVLAGRKADLRAADATHRETLKAALTSTLHLAKAAGQSVSSAAQGEIARTLESLPAAGETPGRLSKPLSPSGFEALQGMPIRPRAEKPSPAAERAPKADNAEEAQRRKQAERERHAAREREQKARATVSRLQKQLAVAERQSAAAKAAWDSAQETESRRRADLTEAEAALQQATTALREIRRD